MVSWTTIAPARSAPASARCGSFWLRRLARKTQQTEQRQVRVWRRKPVHYFFGRPRLRDVTAASLALYKTPRAMTRASMATNEPQTPMPKKWPYKPDERRVLDITRTGETRTDRRRATPRADAARRSARCRSGRAPGPEGPPSRGSPPAPGRSRGSSWS